eukprot:767948-Hanusia_phi.AAC.2
MPSHSHNLSAAASPHLKVQASRSSCRNSPMRRVRLQLEHVLMKWYFKCAAMAMIEVEKMPVGLCGELTMMAFVLLADRQLQTSCSEKVKPGLCNLIALGVAPWRRF